MTLVFLHIDKTGGMSVRELLARQFETTEIMPVPHHAKATYQTNAYPAVQVDLFEANRRFVHDPAHCLVMGHYDWRVVERIPEPMVVTVLREPVERAVSLWRFVCRERALFGGASERASELGLARWARFYSGTYANQMTAQLAGVRWSRPGQVDSDVFVKAARNLRQCALVGVFEKLDDFVVRLGQFVMPKDLLWSWHPILPHVNQNDVQVEVDEATAEYIRQASRYDIELYEIARMRWASIPS